MNIIYWLVFAAIIWVGGYWLARLSIGENLSSREVFILTPKWLYFLCGKPQGKDVPTRVMTIKALYFQICALLMTMYAVIFLFVKSPASFEIDWFVLGWVGSLGLAIIVCVICWRFLQYVE